MLLLLILSLLLLRPCNSLLNRNTNFLLLELLLIILVGSCQTLFKVGSCLTLIKIGLSETLFNWNVCDLSVRALVVVNHLLGSLSHISHFIVDALGRVIVVHLLVALVWRSLLTHISSLIHPII